LTPPKFGNDLPIWTANSAPSGRYCGQPLRASGRPFLPILRKPPRAKGAAMDRLDALDAKLDEVLSRLAPPRRFLSVNAAAEYASLSPDSIRRMIERRDLTPLRPTPRRIVIDREELERVVLGSKGH
jgi:hypothetical protein